YDQRRICRYCSRMVAHQLCDWTASRYTGRGSGTVRARPLEPKYILQYCRESSGITLVDQKFTPTSARIPNACEEKMRSRFGLVELTRVHMLAMWPTSREADVTSQALLWNSSTGW